MYPIRKAELGDRISSGNASFGYVGSLSGRRPSDPFGGFLNYKTQQSESEDAIDDTEPTVSGLAGVEKLFGKAYGSTEAPNATLRRRSDIIRDKMARRKYRAIKRGEEYNPDQDFGLAGKIQNARKAILEKKLDKTTDSMLASGQEAAQLQRERVAKDVKNIDIADDLTKELGMMGVESKSYTSPKAGYQLPTEESAEEKRAFKKTERLDKNRDRIENALNNLAQSQSMQSKYQQALNVKDAKEQMRKEQGRYGFPYTSDFELTDEQSRMVSGERKYGGKIYSRGGGIRPIR